MPLRSAKIPSRKNLGRIRKAMKTPPIQMGAVSFTTKTRRRFRPASFIYMLATAWPSPKLVRS